MPDLNMAGYTVYWCQGSQNDFTCDTDLEWQTLPASARNVTIALPANDTYFEYLFGMSAETTDASSGIVWSTCVYEDGKVSAPPRIKIKERYSHSLKISLEKPSCAESRGYITGYNVLYCRLNKEGNCDGT
ncbi:hypothetical protein NP493_1134g01021 [Ridgeia piscesae]|uniref:Uncharacterized protein n=1 Tax=Ridgeia piscesae TaxID=27915 RepID=A0AAD9KGP1_RIDPI|nr:hypothetical protein NP493_1134g01021 [Ridgeia piscesae]